MRIGTSNYPHFYKNPDSAQDFAQKRVEVSKYALDTIILDGIDATATEIDSSFTMLDKLNAIVITNGNDTPLNIKTQTQDGYIHYGYKDGNGTPVDDITHDGRTQYRTNYKLNIWEAIVRPHIAKLRNANPEVQFLESHEDPIIYEGDLKDIDTTQTLQLKDTSDESIYTTIAGIININATRLMGEMEYMLNVEDEKITLTPKAGSKYFINKIIDWAYTIVETPDNIEQPIVYFEINLYKQKTFGDTQLYNPMTIMNKIGDKTIDNLYFYNKLLKTTSINFYYGKDASQVDTFTSETLDGKNINRNGINYQGMVAKASALKKGINVGDKEEIWEVKSDNTQHQLLTLIDDDAVKSLNSIRDYVAPQYDGAENNTKLQKPQPWLVEFNALSKGNRQTDIYIDDNPAGLLAQIIVRQAVAEGWGDETICKYAKIGENKIYFIEIPTNGSPKIYISGLDEENSLEYKMKKIFKNLTLGIYDEETEPLFLKPEACREQIIGDSTNYLQIDASGIKYRMRYDQLENNGLTMQLNLCWTYTQDIFFNFTSYDGLIDMNNDLNPYGNNSKTNLGLENNRTLLIYGDNADNMIDSNATGTYTNFINTKKTLDFKKQDTIMSDINKDVGAFVGLFNPKNSIVKDISSLVKTGESTYQDIRNLKGANEKAVLEQANEFNNINNSTQEIASKPYKASFGTPTGLYTRYMKELQPNARKINYQRVNRTGYTRQVIDKFMSYDNRYDVNYIKLDTSYNNAYIREILIDGKDLYSTTEYIDMTFAGLAGGICIGESKVIPPIELISNRPKVLPPTPTTGRKDIGQLITNIDMGLTKWFSDDSANEIWEYVKFFNPQLPEDLTAEMLIFTRITGDYGKMHIGVKQPNDNYYGEASVDYDCIFYKIGSIAETGAILSLGLDELGIKPAIVIGGKASEDEHHNIDLLNNFKLNVPSELVDFDVGSISSTPNGYILINLSEIDGEKTVDTKIVSIEGSGDYKDSIGNTIQLRHNLARTCVMTYDTELIYVLPRNILFNMKIDPATSYKVYGTSLTQAYDPPSGNANMVHFYGYNTSNQEYDTGDLNISCYWEAVGDKQYQGFDNMQNYRENIINYSHTATFITGRPFYYFTADDSWNTPPF